MHRRCVPGPEIEARHWLIEAIAAEIAAGSPHDPQAWVARLSARLDAAAPETVDPYLAAMFTDPD